MLFALDYRCGEGNYWSGVYTFRTLRGGESWSPRLAVYGDLGTDGQSLQFLQDEVKQGNFDVILHVGKFRVIPGIPHQQKAYLIA